MFVATNNSDRISNETLLATSIAFVLTRPSIHFVNVLDALWASHVPDSIQCVVIFCFRGYPCCAEQQQPAPVPSQENKFSARPKISCLHLNLLSGNSRQSGASSQWQLQDSIYVIYATRNTHFVTKWLHHELPQFTFISLPMKQKKPYEVDACWRYSYCLALGAGPPACAVTRCSVRSPYGVCWAPID